MKTKFRTTRNKTTRNKTTRKNKRYNKKSKTAKRGGFTDYLNNYFTKKPTTETSTTETPTPETSKSETSTPETPSQEPKKYGSIKTGVTSSVKRSASAYNMPAILGALSTKMNALLIHSKVNYQFSNGYNARDYSIESVPANGDNDGRGVLNVDAKRGEIIGVQSKIYNMGNDSYNKYKNKQ